MYNKDSTDPSKYFMTTDQFLAESALQRMEGPNGWLLFAACDEGLDLAIRVKAEYDGLLASHRSTITTVPLLNALPKVEEHGGSIIRAFADTETAPNLPDHVAGSNVYVFQCAHELQSGYRRAEKTGLFETLSVIETAVNEAANRSTSARQALLELPQAFDTMKRCIERVAGYTVDHNTEQLLKLVYTLRVHRANRITAVIPYLPGSRQEKPSTFERDAAIAKFYADQFRVAGANGVITYHLHADAIHMAYEPKISLTALNGLDGFIETTREILKDTDKGEVIVCSTDAGSAKLIVHLARAADLEHAIANKFRPRPEEAHILGIIGNICGKKKAILADDESVTAKSLINAGNELHTRHGVPDIYILISSNKIRPEHVDQLVNAYNNGNGWLREFHVTDNIPQTPEMEKLPFVKVHPLAEKIARVINRLHYNHSVSELSYDPKRARR